MYGSFAPNKTLFARFWMTLAIRRSPLRISLDGVLETKPSTSGATIAGQKNRKNTNAPTAVYFASGNRGCTASEMMLQILRKAGGMLDEEAQMSSMKTLATIRSCRAFF